MGFSWFWTRSELHAIDTVGAGKMPAAPVLRPSLIDLS
jgi:hypothetical protein